MIFIDCGFYRGNALKIYMDKGIVDKTWTIYAFEPNPELGTKQHIKDFFGDMKIEFIPKAIWTNDGSLKFHIGGREDAASVKGTSGHTMPKKITVPSIDLSRFIAELPDEFIICSMDIEGAEYRVLKKMLKEGSINRIDLLDVEFHHRLMAKETIDDSQTLLDELVHHTAVKVKERFI